MSVHLSLLSQMKTVSDSIYDVQGLVLLFLVVFTRREEGTIARAQNMQICHSVRCKQIGLPTADKFLAELQGAKGVSEAPWVRKNDNPSSRENFMTTLVERRRCVSMKRKRLEYTMPTASFGLFSIHTVSYT